MKTNVIRIVSLIGVIFIMSSFVTSAQSRPAYLLDQKYTGQKITQTLRYELNVYSGMYDKSLLYINSYDELGNLLKLEIFRWNKKKTNWESDSRIQFTHNELTNQMIGELVRWNKETQQYDAPVEQTIYHLDESGLVVALDMVKENQQPYHLETDPCMVYVTTHRENSQGIAEW